MIFARRYAGRLDFGLLSALRRYGQIIFALVRREHERRLRSPLESVADVLEPILYICLIAFMWSFLNRRASSPLGDSSILFISTGLYAKFYWITLARLRKIVGTLHRFPVERRLDYILVYLFLTTADYLLLAFVGFGILYIFFTEAAVPYNFVPVIQAMFAVMALGFGWGMMSKTFVRYFWPWAYIGPLFNRAMILFSGIFFLVEFLPPTPRYVLSFNPMMHAIALFRTGFYPNYPTGILDTTYLAYCALIFVFVGLVLERITVRFEAT
jgi:capsular polysaccharide transport system permease protein